jgi:hypothetical protein
MIHIKIKIGIIQLKYKKMKCERMEDQTKKYFFIYVIESIQVSQLKNFNTIIILFFSQIQI